MTFSLELKQELIEHGAQRSRQGKARAYGFFLFLRRPESGQPVLATESPELARLYGKLARDVLGKNTPIIYDTRLRSGKEIHLARLGGDADITRLAAFVGAPDRIDRQRLPARDDVGAFLAGAFLACGSMTDPAKSYHLEFITRQGALADHLAQLLEEAIPGVKQTERRRSHVAYYKDKSQIEDLLTLMGASRASLAMIDVEMIKEVRNRANRVTNCETANIDKTVDAAAQQLADIGLLRERCGLDSLPEPLREAATLRLENPDLSLRELAALCGGPVSRSAMHRRLEKLARLADKLRAAGSPES